MWNVRVSLYNIYVHVLHVSLLCVVYVTLWSFEVLYVSAGDASLFAARAGANGMTGNAVPPPPGSRMRGGGSGPGSGVVSTLGGAGVARSATGADVGLACEHCGKVCPRPSILKRHMMMHTGERPFECKVTSFVRF